MADLSNQAPRRDFEVYRGAPKPVILRERVNGVLRAFDASLKLVAKPKGQAVITLGVGTGITLTTDESVANARATILLSKALSLTVPEGRHCPFEILEGPDGFEVVFMAGSLAGSVVPK